MTSFNFNFHCEKNYENAARFSKTNSKCHKLNNKKSERSLDMTNSHDQMSMASLSLFDSSRCVVDRTSQSSASIESHCMELDNATKITGHDYSHLGRYTCAKADIKSSNVRRLSWIKIQERRKMGKSRHKIESQDSTTSEESDLHKEFQNTAVLNDLKEIGILDIKPASEKRRRNRYCCKDKKKKINPESPRKDYFDLTIDDFESDISELTVESFDYFENFEANYDFAHDETSKSVELVQVTNYDDMRNTVFPEVHQRGFSRQIMSRCERNRQIFQDSLNAECTVDSLIYSSWQEHLKLLDDWKQFTKQLSNHKIGSGSCKHLTNMDGCN
jgi:hypothetical protein